LSAPFPLASSGGLAFHPPKSEVNSPCKERIPILWLNLWSDHPHDFGGLVGVLVFRSYSNKETAKGIKGPMPPKKIDSKDYQKKFTVKNNQFT